MASAGMSCRSWVSCPVSVIPRVGDKTPFQNLLKQLNETHSRGLEVDEDDA